jgi:hypothetical protein
MGIGDYIGGNHGTRSNTIVYGTSDQGSYSFVVVECQDHQIQRTSDRSERNRCVCSGSVKSQRVKSLKISAWTHRRSPTPMHFRHRQFSRGLIWEHLVKLIADRRSLILFGIDRVGSVVKTIS